MKSKAKSFLKNTYFICIWIGAFIGMAFLIDYAVCSYAKGEGLLKCIDALLR